MSEGLFGFLDFVGYPVGAPAAAVTGRGFRGAGRHLLHAAQAAEFESRLAEMGRRRVVQLAEMAAGHWASFEEARRKSLEAAMYSLLLTEI